MASSALTWIATEGHVDVGVAQGEVGRAGTGTAVQLDDWPSTHRTDIFST